jgi:hypothetical protein
MHVNYNGCRCVCKKLEWNIKYGFEFAYNDLLDRKHEIIFIASIPKSATKKPMLIKLTRMLIITVVNVCAKN